MGSEGFHPDERFGEPGYCPDCGSRLELIEGEERDEWGPCESCASADDERAPESPYCEDYELEFGDW